MSPAWRTRYGLAARLSPRNLLITDSNREFARAIDTRALNWDDSGLRRVATAGWTEDTIRQKRRVESQKQLRWDDARAHSAGNDLLVTRCLFELGGCGGGQDRA